MLVGVAVSALCLVACKGGRSQDPGGAVSESAANRYLRKAIRSSSEGVILLPSTKAATFYEADLLNAVAQDLRRPAAACFVNRTIQTMTRVRRDGRWIFTNIPEGQFKVRVRLTPEGNVLRADVLESGFVDHDIEPCLLDVIHAAEWPTNSSAVPHYVDVVYWVSLGAQGGATLDEVALRLRKEQVAAGLKAKRCLEGKLPPGSHRVESLSLIDREGNTLVNRVEPFGVDEDAATCVAAALKRIRLAREPESFVRPVAPVLELEVAKDGTLELVDEDWYALVLSEERARRAALRAQLQAEESVAGAKTASDAEPRDAAAAEAPALGAWGNRAMDPPSDAVASPTPVGREGPLDPEVTPEGDLAPESNASPPAASPAPRDPAEAGLKLDLRGHRDD